MSATIHSLDEARERRDRRRSAELQVRFAVGLLFGLAVAWAWAVAWRTR